MMIIVIMMMIIIRVRCDDVVNARIVYALAIYDAVLFGNGGRDGRTNKEILGVGLQNVS